MYNQDVVNKVRETDMVDFLAAEYNWSITRVSNCYSTEEHDSIMIRSDRRHWYWNSRGIGGVGVIDWLSKIEGLSFVQTMNKMVGKSYDTAVVSKRIEPNNNGNSYFDEGGIPQQTNGKFANLFAYLIQTRCISNNIVTDLVKEKRLYQDVKNNVVFTNLDEQGNIGFWSLRGTNTKVKYTMNAPGADNKYYGFTLNCNPDSDTVYVFEAPIDLLSHCTIADIKANKSGAWREQNRIALLGVNDYALECYLPMHPNIKTIKFCLDNDEAGIKATEKYSRKYSELGYHIEEIFYNGPGKDMNEVLCNHTQRIQMKKEAAPKQTVLSQETESEAEHEEEHTTKKMNSDRYIMGT